MNTNILAGFDKKYYNDDVRIIAGVDEAGRGPLAGPMVAAAVILPNDVIIEGINDSKKLSEKVREKLYDEICMRCTVSVAIVPPYEIDKKGIGVCNIEGMRNAVNDLCVKPDFVLVDYFLITDLDIPQINLKKGDRLSQSIAAASIVAKVTRDKIMYEYAKQFPLYGLEKHKGYPTKKHYEAIYTHGICHIHRKSFLKSFFAGEKNESNKS